MERTVYCAACAAPREVTAEPGEEASCPECGGPLQVPSGCEVFISHSSVDAAEAAAVCRALEGRGIPCWIAPRDIKLGSSWAQAIVEALGRVRVMVLLL